MRSYRELSLRYIKSKKVRSLWVVIGIIISVALITGVFTLGDSFKNKMINDIEKERKYHLALTNVDENELTEILKDINIEKAGFEVISGGIITENSEEGYKDLFITNISKDALYLNVVENRLLEGRLPQAKGEIVINEKYLKSINKNIGDKIEIKYEDFYDNDDMVASGTIVGTTNENLVYNFIDEADLKDTNYMVYLRYKDPNYTLKAIEAMEKKFGYKNIANGQIPEKINGEIQETYLTLLGADVGSGTLDLLNNMTIVLVVLVVISSAGLIYNGFMISISERKKEFGLLRAVGMSKRQIRKIVIKEAMLIGCVGITIGVLSGILGIYILLKVITNMNVSRIGEIDLSVSIMSVVLSIIVSIITIAISVTIPIRKASKVSAVQGMKNTFAKEENIKFQKKNGVSTRFFGAAGYLANRNLRRNRGRFKAVILGFTLSIFIFVSFSSFAEIITNIMEIQNYISGYSIEVNGNNSEESNVAMFESIEGVKKAYNEYRFENTKENTAETFINEYEIVSDESIFSQKFKDVSNINSIRFDFRNVEYDSLSHMNISNKITKEQFEKGIVIQNRGVAIEGNKKTPFELTNIKLGDKIDLVVHYQDFADDTFESKQNTMTIKDVEVVGFIEDGIAVTSNGIEYPKAYLGNDIAQEIMSDLGMKKVISSTKIVPIDESYSESVYNELNNNQEKYNIWSVNSPLESQREWIKMVLVGKIGVYGFLILVTLITITNIITSVSSSIDNRRKEIALYRSIGTSQKRDSR